MARTILVVVGLLLTGFMSPAAAFQKRTLIRFDENSYIGFDNNRGAHLDVRVKNAADLEDTVKIYTGRFSDATFSMKQYKIARLSKTQAIVPYLALSPGFKRAFLKKLWPKDYVKNNVLHHTVTVSSETLWGIAQMYTGFGNNYRAIKKASNLHRDGLKLGMELKIPYPLLMELLRDQPTIAKEPPLAEPMAVEVVGEDVKPLPPPRREERVKEPVKEPPPSTKNSAVPVEDEARPSVPVPAGSKQTPAQPLKTATSAPQEGDAAAGILAQLKELEQTRKELTYGKDSRGRYGEYRLKRGEAIYSSVVVRFCGLVSAKEVNQLAKIIIMRNRIHDETDMPIGARIRIPYENLEPEFKGDDDPEYLDFVSNLNAVAVVSSNVASRNLDGVTVILDAGHGGKDSGADRKQVWEDDFVYDILCRVKKRLEEESNATVISTILDNSVQYKVQDVTLFRRDTDEHLRTNPPYKLTNKNMTVDGVNLRWMLANNHYSRLVKAGADPDKILFASFHADALHRSLRGSMVYIPDGRHFPAQVSPRAHLKRYNVSNGNSFNNTTKSVQKAQARSMQFASNYVKTSRDLGVRVHRAKPIRSLIYRNPTRPFVPAVIRFNRIPTRVLIEICNLNNPNDQNLLKRPDFRQKVADAFVAAVLHTYGNETNASAAQSGTAVGSRGE